MYVVKNRETGKYYGTCHTVGDTIWLDDINHPSVEKFNTIEGLKGWMNYVPLHKWFTTYKIVQI